MRKRGIWQGESDSARGRADANLEHMEHCPEAENCPRISMRSSRFGRGWWRRFGRDYHHDHRNVLTHVVGIPLIVLSITTLLAPLELPLPTAAIPLSLVAAVLAAGWYLSLDLKLGLLMTFLLALFVIAGAQIASISTTAWLGGGVGLFVVGWIFQLVGHKYEGRKPAFVDDLRSFLVGPLFLVVEGLFALGLMSDLRREVEG